MAKDKSDERILINKQLLGSLIYENITFMSWLRQK